MRPKPDEEYPPGPLGARYAGARETPRAPGPCRYRGAMPILDHVVWGVPAIQPVADALLATHGLTTLPGGVHPAWGTRNAVIPLAGAYLELVEVFDPDAPMVGFTAVVARAADAGAGLCMWCERTDDIEADAATRGLHVTHGERDNPDGSILTWRVAGMAEACADPAMPFLIQWDDHATMPGSIVVDHPAGEARIVGLDIEPSGPSALRISSARGIFTLP